VGPLNPIEGRFLFSLLFLPSLSLSSIVHLFAFFHFLFPRRALLWFFSDFFSPKSLLASPGLGLGCFSGGSSFSRLRRFPCVRFFFFHPFCFAGWFFFSLFGLSAPCVLVSFVLLLGRGEGLTATNEARAR